MNEIKRKLKLIEKKYGNKNNTAVLVVDQNPDGTYKLDGKIYTQAQLDKYRVDNMVDVLIIDNI